MPEDRVSKPWLEHGPIRPSENGHYLIHRDGTPFLWMGDTSWALNSMSDGDILRMLEDRRRKGFTLIQVCASRTWEDGGPFGDMTWANTDANGEAPFAGGDITRFNPTYWERWRNICAMVADRGLYLLFMAGEVGNGSLDRPNKCKNKEEFYEYGKRFGRYFSDVPNKLYCVSMDSEGFTGAGIEGWRALARGLAEGDGEDSLFMTYHPWSTSSKWFHRDKWLTANGVQGSRNEAPDNDILVYQRVFSDYCQRDPVKPVLFLEGSYEGERNMDGMLPEVTPRNVRMQFYYAMFAGAAGFTYGHCKNWQQCKDVNYVDSPGSEQMRIGIDFVNAHQWWLWQPKQSLIMRGEEEGEQRKTAVLAEDGGECLVFFPENSAADIRLDRLPGRSSVDTYWFNPTDGVLSTEQAYPAQGARRFSPPSEWEDAILILK